MLALLWSRSANSLQTCLLTFHITDILIAMSSDSDNYLFQVCCARAGLRSPVFNRLQTLRTPHVGEKHQMVESTSLEHLIFPLRLFRDLRGFEIRTSRKRDPGLADPIQQLRSTREQNLGWKKSGSVTSNWRVLAGNGEEEIN